MAREDKASLSDLPDHIDKEASKSQGHNTHFLRKLQGLRALPSFPCITMSGLVDAAIVLLDAGFSVIPCGADKKCSLSTWKTYQPERMTEAEPGDPFNFDKNNTLFQPDSQFFSCLEVRHD